MKKERKMKKVLFPILAVVLALGLALPMAAAPVMAAAITDSYYSGNADFDTETVAVSTSFVNYGTGGVTYGAANTVVNCWTHGAWVIVKTNYPQLATANWVSSATLVEDPVGDSWRQFVSTFQIPAGATSLSAVLESTADNSYEVLLNGTSIGSEGVVYGNATNLGTDYWSVIESWSGATIDGALQTGTNTLTIVARNWAQTSGTTGSNPTGLIYKLTVTYDEVNPSIEVEKDYRYTNVCFERDNDLDGLFNEDPVDFDPTSGLPIDNDGDLLFNEDDIDCPLGTDLGGLLPMDNGNYVLEAVIHPKNNKVMSYNPGQYYAVSTVDVLDDVDKLTILEDWSACAGISVLNPKNGGGRVVIVQVGGEIMGEPVPDPLAAYQILDANMVGVTFPTATSAKAVLQNVAAGTTILMYVKFGPGLKGETWVDTVDPCVNYNWASVLEEPNPLEPSDWVEASAMLIVVEKE